MAKPAPEWAVVAEGDDLVDRRDAWVDHDLVADGDAGDVVADRLDDAGDVAAGDVRQRRFGQPAGRPHVEVVEGAGDDADLHLVGGGRWQLDLTPAVRPG